ncbi:hypothetical protein [Usitatibacter palustris]|uniref:DUF1579 domain-containing protein n=1 Tax=Usitatibacter palustris TaxID=2732487 RepID=A0A6M4H9S8_9PROT|nr:hypothetical protein [Usitatibacter palustris]QJR16012.1 hypothetical protein DSM104440_02840 [Usitatibacter palustris]
MRSLCLVAVIAAALVAASFSARAQTPPQPKYGCDSPESKQLDFWVGEWELTYGGMKSRNRITKVLDGCAILEEFSGAPGSKLDGRSFSQFDTATKQWKQTWVDNTGGYLDFNGGIVEGQMQFWRDVQKDGKKIRSRMVWRDVKTDTLTWLWQSSADEGKTWKTLWEIAYKRLP